MCSIGREENRCNSPGICQVPGYFGGGVWVRGSKDFQKQVSKVERELIESRYNISNLQPEKLAQNIFEYNNVILNSEKELIHRKIFDTSKEGGAMPTVSSNSIRDLHKYFQMHNEGSKESNLNYFLIKKWMGREYRKKRKNNPMALVYLSVDFYFSIYVVKLDKKGRRVNQLKACFPAERSDIKAKPLEKIIEISFVDKGLLWDSKKKITLEFNAKQIDEFALHHQQAKVLFGATSKLSAPRKSITGNKMYQSSIVTKGAYQDATMGIESMSNSGKSRSKITTILESQLTSEPKQRLNTSMTKSKEESEEEYDLENSSFKFNPMSYNSNPNRNIDFNLERYEDNLDDIEKNYTSEKMINMNNFGEFQSQNREFDREMLEQIKAEINMFKKNVDTIENISDYEDQEDSLKSD
jgi:hypothetical protein